MGQVSVVVFSFCPALNSVKTASIAQLKSDDDIVAGIHTSLGSQLGQYPWASNTLDWGAFMLRFKDPVVTAQFGTVDL